MKWMLKSGLFVHFSSQSSKQAQNLTLLLRNTQSLYNIQEKRARWCTDGSPYGGTGSAAGCSERKNDEDGSWWPGNAKHDGEKVCHGRCWSERERFSLNPLREKFHAAGPECFPPLYISSAVTTHFEINSATSLFNKEPHRTHSTHFPARVFAPRNVFVRKKPRTQITRHF